MGIFAKLFGPKPPPSLGAQGEQAAARHLKDKGYSILARNWRHQQWELDLVCRDGGTIVFVEVKTRSAGSMTEPGEAMTRAKQAKLVKAASHYLTEHGLWDAPCRFDLAAVSHTGDSFRVVHEKNVIDAGGLER